MKHKGFTQVTIMWYIFSSKNVLWTLKYGFVITIALIITKSYLPLGIVKEDEEFEITIFVAVVRPSGIAAHCLHSNGDIMKKIVNTSVNAIINIYQQLLMYVILKYIPLHRISSIINTSVKTTFTHFP